MKRKVGYLGTGTFGEQVALLYAPEADLIAYRSHGEAILALEAGEIDEAIVAIENSLQGPVIETVDALLRQPRLFVTREFILPVEHNLIAAPGTKLRDIKVVMSHPQALSQCQGYLSRHLPGVRLDAALSTAAAVEDAVRTPGAAGIGTRRAAEVFGGEVLAAGIQDTDNNKTRFFVLGTEEAAPTGNDRTSLAFEVPDRPGSLVEVLMEFSRRGVNLSRIESRPSREELGKYVFLIDCDGHRLDEKPAQALEAIRAKGARLLPADRPWGSYPRFVELS